MKKPNPNFDHNMFKNCPAVTAQNTVDLVSPENLASLQSGQSWYLGHNLSYKTLNRVIQKKKYN